jgi:FkbM family methyltransferase
VIARTVATRFRPGWVDPAGVTGGTVAHRLARRLLPVPARWALARLRWDLVETVRETAETARAIGWPAATSLRWAEFAGHCTAARRVRRVTIPGEPYPLYYREGTSDPFVIEQVFGRSEYACVATERAVRTIVDCGANVGYTARYLLNRYPAARLVAVEPDPGNLALCRKNLAPYGDRVTVLAAAVCGQSGPMAMDRTGSEWAFVARPARPGEPPEFDGLTVADVLARAGFDTADILKIDVEGAEERIFTSAPGAWLPRVKNLVIELHGEACEAAVVGALAEYDYDRSTSGELTVFKGLGPA